MYKKSCVNLCLFGIALLLFSLSMTLNALEKSALDIMNQVADRPIGDDTISTMHFYIEDKQGKKRERHFQMWSKADGENRMNLMFVDVPKTLFNTGFLSLDSKTDEPQDKQWLYLSALSQTKRISTKNKSQQFLGSYFSYYDMTLLNTGKFSYSLVDTETWENDLQVWKIQATANNDDVIKETGYRESLFWVRADPYLILKAVHQTDNPNRRKEYVLKDYQQQEGIWILKHSEMHRYYNDKLEQSTQSKISEVKFNQDLDDRVFTVRRLEKGL